MHRVSLIVLFPAFLLLTSCIFLPQPQLIDLQEVYEVGSDWRGYNFYLPLSYYLTEPDPHGQYKFVLLEGPGIIKGDSYYFIPKYSDIGKTFTVRIKVIAPDGRTQIATFKLKVVPESEVPLLYKHPECYFDPLGYYDFFARNFKDKLPHVSLTIEGKELAFYYGGNKFYLHYAEGQYRVVPYDFSNQRDIYLFDRSAINNNLIKINGTTYKVRYSVLNPKDHVVATVSEYGVIAFHDTGIATFVINVGSQEASFTVNVLKSPVGDFICKDELLDALGVPDKQAEKIFPWYSPEGFFEGIYYKFGNDEDTKVIHWHYEKYPDLIFSSWTGIFDPMFFVYHKTWDSGYTGR